ncbi:MAG: lanthionine synthetase LanC family protein [Acidimicrobiales bacterium]
MTWGNADFLQLAADVLGEPRWRREALWRAHGVLADAAEIGAWRCSATDLVEQPGLLTGLAGIGYGLLRLAVPSLVPSVLALEGPRPRG